MGFAPVFDTLAVFRAAEVILVLWTLLPAALTLTRLLQLTEFSFKKIKYWSGFAGGSGSKTLNCSANAEIKKILIHCVNTGPFAFWM